MNDLPTLESALYGGQDAGGYRFLARSTGFREEWLADAERLCIGFGERPAGVNCPRAVFAQPYGKDHVAVVQVADMGSDDQGRPGTLGFYIVLVPQALYAWLGGDPFHLADQMPPPWAARGVLSPLTCPQPSPYRRVDDVQKILNVPNSATLLGGVQALLDGGRLVVERSAPDEALLRSMWQLLPLASRADFWPASYAFSNTLKFHAVVVPRIVPDQFTNYVREEQAGDYPEGKYEYDLQAAAEEGDQSTLDTLFARRSYREIRRIGLLLLVVVIVLPVVAGLLNRTEEKPKPEPKPPVQKSKVDFDLPPANRFAPLGEAERDALRTRLVTLLQRLKVRPPLVDGTVLMIGANRDPLSLTAQLILEDAQWLSVEGLLLDALDRRLGTPDSDRKGGDLHNLGPIERQLRGLLWKHGIERYNDLKLKPTELLEQLEEKLIARKVME